MALFVVVVGLVMWGKPELVLVTLPLEKLVVAEVTFVVAGPVMF